MEPEIITAIDQIEALCELIDPEQIDELDQIEDVLLEHDDSLALGTEPWVNWALRLLANTDAEIARVSAQAESIIHDLRAQNERRLRQWEPALADYCQRNLPYKKRSLKLIQGTVGFRTKPGGPVIEDEEKCFEFALENIPDAVKETCVITDQEAANLFFKEEQEPSWMELRPSLLKTPIKAYVKETGDIPPGVRIDKDIDVFYVKFPNGDKE